MTVQRTIEEGSRRQDGHYTYTCINCTPLAHPVPGGRTLSTYPSSAGGGGGGDTGGGYE